MLQLREKEIISLLKSLNNFDFVVIGGYAVNAYTLPRFSVDCDIVVKQRDKLMEKKLEEQDYIRADLDDALYSGEFLRFEKTLENNFKVIMDILVKEVLDRQTNVVFKADWIFKNSSLRVLKGKTINEELRLRIIDLNALVVMKFISCRNTDIRDVFMLMPKANKEWVRKEASARCDFMERFSKIKKKIVSEKFKDDLQGVYGFIDENVFEKHKKAVLEI